MNHEKNIIDQIQPHQGGKSISTKRNKNVTKIHKIAKDHDIAIAIIPKKTETKKIENQRKNLKVEEKSKSTPVQMPVTMKNMAVTKIFINRGKYFNLRSIANTPTQNYNWLRLLANHHPRLWKNTVTKTDFTEFTDFNHQRPNPSRFDLNKIELQAKYRTGNLDKISPNPHNIEKTFHFYQISRLQFAKNVQNRPKKTILTKINHLTESGLTHNISHGSKIMFKG